MSFRNRENKKGISIIELTISVSVLMFLLAITPFSYSLIFNENKLEAEGLKIKSTVFNAFEKTLSGTTIAGGSTASSFGIHFDLDAYTLFSGLEFNPADQGNEVFNLETGLVINENHLPEGNIVFERLSGEVLNFDGTNNYLVLQELNTKKRVKISVNKIGVVSLERLN